jgi:hypothetical protein
MMKVQKATVGIRFSERIFRISTLSGNLIDDVFSLRRGPLTNDHFAAVGRDRQGNGFTMSNEEYGNYLTVDIENVTYTQDLYDSDRDFDFEKFFHEFGAIWAALDSQLQAPHIRRIGYVCEHRIEDANASQSLLKALTPHGNGQGYPAKFNLSFEVRKNTGHGGLPDPIKDDFLNLIYGYYDSSLDTSHAQDGAFNANLDVQRYYSPALKDKVLDEFRKVKGEYDKAAKQFFADLRKQGLANG